MDVNKIKIKTFFVQDRKSDYIHQQNFPIHYRKYLLFLCALLVEVYIQQFVNHLDLNLVVQVRFQYLPKLVDRRRSLHRYH